MHKLIKITSTTVVLALAACASSTSWMPQKAELEKWFQVNEATLDKLFDQLSQDRELRNIWTLDEEHRFRRLVGEQLEPYIPENADFYRKLLPSGANILYLNSEVGLFIGPGAMQSCMGNMCTAEIVRFRGQTSLPVCSKQVMRNAPSDCIYPLEGPWHLRYLVFDINA